MEHYLRRYLNEAGVENFTDDEIVDLYMMEKRLMQISPGLYVYEDDEDVAVEIKTRSNP